MTKPSYIVAPGAPAAKGHYSQGAAAHGLVFTAVQLPIDPADPDRPPPPVADQVRQVLANLDAVLVAGGSSLAAALRIMIYVTDIGLWPEVDRAYAEAMGTARPARGVVAVTGLHLGFSVAMEAIGAAT